MPIITVFIIEDHRLLRETWVAFLQKEIGIHVAGHSGNGESALEKIKQTKPEIVLLDIRMQPLDGFVTLHALQQLDTNIKVIALSLYIQPGYVTKMLALGIMGYLTKNCSIPELVMAIKEVTLGNKYLSEEIKKILAEEPFFPEACGQDLSLLSPIEQKIVCLLKTGKSAKEIAACLELTIRMTEVHKKNILKKLSLKNTASLTNFFNSNR